MGDTSEDKLDYDEYNFTEIKACTAGLDTVLDIAFAEAFETSGERADRVICDALSGEDTENIDKIKEYLSNHCAVEKLCYLTNNTLFVCTEGSDYIYFNPGEHGTNIGWMII